jgi:long-chain acyl-CoA synthetase
MQLGNLVEHWAKERPNQPALVSDDKAISFTELNKSVNRVANGLRKLGIQEGDRVAIMLPNIPEFMFTFYACQKLGAVAVPFNTMYKGKEIIHIVRDSGAKAIVCLTNSVTLINEIRSELPDLKHIITTGERTLTFADPGSTLFVQAVLSKKIFTDLDDAYRRIGTAAESAFKKLGLQDAWYCHRGSLRMSGKKLAGFLISEVEDIYVINMICFIRPFQPADFFAAIWVPPEVKDKILEPLTSLAEELGSEPSDNAVRKEILESLENEFGVSLKEGGMTREERFGYQKQRSIAEKSVKQTSAEKKSSFFRKLFALPKKDANDDRYKQNAADRLKKLEK